VACDAVEEEITADRLAVDKLNSRHDRVIVIKTRGDQVEGGTEDVGSRSAEEALVVSSVSGEGLDDLRELIAATLSVSSKGERQFVGSTAARSRDSLRRSRESLQRASEAAAGRFGDELVAFETRTGIETLGEIVGTIYTDDLLDQIFSRFCIGK
jgi:tRNA modification GTPase